MDFDVAVGRFERDHSKLRKQQHQRKATKDRTKQLQKERQKRYEKEKERKQKENLKLKKAQSYYNKCEINLLKRKPIGGKERLLLKGVKIEGDGDKVKLPVSILESMMEEIQGNLDSGSSNPMMFRVGIPNSNYTFPACTDLKNFINEDKMELDENDIDEEITTSMFLSELKERYSAYTHAGVIEFTMEEGQVGIPPSIAARLDISENSDIEICRVTLPKGTGCSVQPTINAIKSGFYDLKDVKAVLEQSIIRTRTTLSVSDTLSVWNRGKQFDLNVTSLEPADFNAVSCIDTDIEINILPPPLEKDFTESIQKENALMNQENHLHGTPQTLGRTINSEKSEQDEVMKESRESTAAAIKRMNQELPPEPPADQAKDVCLIQIRSRDGTATKRRFDITKSTLTDLFQFVQASFALDNFQLISRYPRNVYVSNDVRTLIDAGFTQGQQLLMLELTS